MTEPASQSIDRLLAFDFGLKYIGVAVGQTLTQTASPLTTLRAKAGIPNWQEIAELLKKWQPQALVVGIPLNMDGTEQALTFKARAFANDLEARFHLPVFPVDERLSSWEAKQRIFNSTTPKKAKQKLEEDIDAIAAVILLEQWLRSEGQ